MTKKGLFISFEGIDGSGKTTQLNLLESYLKSKGRKVIITREPGSDSNEASKAIREILQHPKYNKQISPAAEICLFAANRALHVHYLIRPQLETGNDVITDRFADSMFAYQGVGRGLPLETILLVNQVATEGITPDITFFIDAEYEASEAKTTTEEFGERDRFESEKTLFKKRVIGGYRALAQIYPQRIKTIEYRSDSIEEMHREIKSHVEKILNQ